MERIIETLLGDFEKGKMSRRQLIQSLALAAAAGSAVPAAAAQASPFEAIAVDHISYQVADYRRSRDFYTDLLGMKVVNDNGTNSVQLQFGDALLIARNRPEPGPAVVDHMAYKIADWDTDRVRAELERRGLEPRLDTGPGDGTYASFHVPDPDGYTVQISGDLKPGDSLYKG